MTSGTAFPRIDVSTRPHKSSRPAFGEGLLEVGRRNPRVVVVAADTARSASMYEFSQEFPQRFFNVGIAEQNMIGVAAGLASCGYIAYAASYAPFICMRAVEQIRDDTAFTGFNVKVGGTAGGITLGPAGSTHHATEDFAVLRSIADLAVLAPADATETYKATVAAADYPGPVYIRLGRNPEPLVYLEEYSFAIGKAVTLKEGRDLAIIATGSMVLPALLAADVLDQEGVQARVIDMHTIKPLDRAVIVKAARETGRIVTVEEHNVLGGLGGAVAEVVVVECPVPMRMVGIPDVFTTVGSVEELRARYGLSWQGVVAASRQALSAAMAGVR